VRQGQSPSPSRDDLGIAGIDKCKGAGRIQFFHHFARVGLTTTYRGASGLESRQLAPTEGVKKIELTDFSISHGDEADIGTTISLDRLKPLFGRTACGDIRSTGSRASGRTSCSRYRAA